jgi:hypothetical protein
MENQGKCILWEAIRERCSIELRSSNQFIYFKSLILILEVGFVSPLEQLRQFIKGLENSK